MDRIGSKWINGENSETELDQWVSELGANYTMAYYDGEVYAKECTQHPLKPMTGPCQQLVHLKVKLLRIIFIFQLLTVPHAETGKHLGSMEDNPILGAQERSQIPSRDSFPSRCFALTKL